MAKRMGKRGKDGQLKKVALSEIKDNLSEYLRLAE